MSTNKCHYQWNSPLLKKKEKQQKSSQTEEREQHQARRLFYEGEKGRFFNLAVVRPREPT